MSNLVELKDGVGNLTRFAYDVQGQLVELVSERSMRNGSTVSVDLEASGNRSVLRLDGDELVSYSYDEASRLVTTTFGANTLALAYDAASRRRSVAMPHGVDATYQFDAMSRLEEVGHGSVARAAYAYDAVGNRTRKETGSFTESYGYDVVSRLVSVGRGGDEVTYGYDDVGNRTSVVGSGVATTSSYGPGNRLLSVAGAGSLAFSYDANGSLVSKVEAGVGWGYEWNAENQLERVTRDGAEVARFAYDPLGRRVEKRAGGIVYRYLYDGMDILRETRSDGTVYTYVHGPGIDEPLARLDQAGSVEYYHADGLGSIVEMTDSTGAVVETRQYDAWGNLEIGADEPGYAYTGREWDPETGLYYYRARYYDPKVGRFISEDPIGFAAGVNFYAYVRNAPASLIDPTGLVDINYFDPSFPTPKERTARFGAEIYDDPNSFVIAGHGNPYAMADDRAGIQNRTRLTPWDVALDVIASSKYRSGMPITLLACRTGNDADGFAQLLASILMTTVKAPSGRILWYNTTDPPWGFETPGDSLRPNTPEAFFRRYKIW